MAGVHILQNFEAIIQSTTLSETDRKCLLSEETESKKVVLIAQVPFSSLQINLNEASILPQEVYNLIKNVFETYKGKTDAVFANIFMEKTLTNYAGKGPTWEEIYRIELNTNLFRSLKTNSDIFECVNVFLYCIPEQCRFDCWYPWDKTTRYNFGEKLKNFKGTLLDTDMKQLYEAKSTECEVLSLILKGREDLRLRFKINALLYPFNQVVKSPEITQIKLQPDSLSQSLYENDSTKDIVIIVEGDKKVKAHKCIIAAGSKELETLITSKMKEGETGVVHFDDMTETGLTQLIRYLYGLPLPIASLTCEIALELIQTAHKYNLNHLESSLTGLFLQNDEKWLTPDVSLQLYFYYRNLSESLQSNNVTKHALKIMTRFPSMEFRSCQKFRELETAEVVELTFKLNDMLRATN